MPPHDPKVHKKVQDKADPATRTCVYAALKVRYEPWALELLRQGDTLLV